MTRPVKFSLALLLTGTLASCTPVAGEAGPDCGERCDNLTDKEIVWSYDEGQHKWATCANEGGTVTCRLETVAEQIQVEQVRVGEVGGFGTFGEMTLGQPEYQYNSSKDITLHARAPGSWAGDIQRDFVRPQNGSSVSFDLPYNVWRVTLTKLDSAKVELLMRHDVEIDGSDGQEFQITKGLSTQYIGGLTIPAGEETLSRTFHFPVTPERINPDNAKMGIWLSASSLFSSPPAFTIDKPGCYLVNGGTQLIFDEGCVQSQEIAGEVLDPDPIDPVDSTCTCDVSEDCDVGCACDEVCDLVVDEGPTCVSGTSGYCDDAGETWANGECCVEDVTECVAGTAGYCDDAGEGWTGDVCCVSGDVQCVSGTAGYCDDAGEGWTGAECCVPAEANCVTGTAGYCDDAGEGWTGELCCVTGDVQCVAGTSGYCDDAGEGWTGTQCCVDDTLTCEPSTYSECQGLGGDYTGELCCQ